MTTEEKAKAYDEALKKAKDMLSYKEVRQEDIEYLFPELKESEDEKIKKAILELVRQSSEILEKKNQEQMIAWLEKQGEKKPTEEYNITGIKSKHAQGKLGEMIMNLKSVNEVLEQKPSEWSVEDETKLTMAQTFIRNTSLIGNDGIKEATIDWLNNLKNRVQPHNRWKPSEAEISILEKAVFGKINPMDYQATLTALIEQLKKLTE